MTHANISTNHSYVSICTLSAYSGRSRPNIFLILHQAKWVSDRIGVCVCVCVHVRVCVCVCVYVCVCVHCVNSGFTAEHFTRGMLNPWIKLWHKQSFLGRSHDLIQNWSKDWHPPPPKLDPRIDPPHPPVLPHLPWPHPCPFEETTNHGVCHWHFVFDFQEKWFKWLWLKSSLLCLCDISLALIDDDDDDDDDVHFYSAWFH